MLDVLELRVDHVTAHRGDRLTPRTWKEDMSSILLVQAYTLERIKNGGWGRWNDEIAHTCIILGGLLA